MIPQEFLDRMEQMLGAEFADFLAAYDRPRAQALRLNPLKAVFEAFEKQVDFTMSKVAWEENGYYYEAGDKPGKHPYHEAGVYYIQEPSAMLPAALLNAQPGECVLDLCAAPGGKSTQIGAAMKGQGILICNEIHPARAKILSENIERMGIINAVVTNETPQRLAAHFHDYFDCIMVDAPCSGEGMFRKAEAACEEWNPANVIMCAKRQDEILDCAYTMLRPGGRLVYSTCTFAPEEDEGSVSRLQARYPDMNIKDMIRLWPHKIRGEGHFAAVLQKDGPALRTDSLVHKEEAGVSIKEIKDYIAFREEYLRKDLTGIYIRFGEQLYLAPAHLPSLQRLKVLRPGLHLGTLRKNRFEPSHALALSLRAADVRNTFELSLQDAEGARKVCDYLKGQTFAAEGERGWYLVNVDGYSIGWGKLTGQIMKNHYPKGLRKQL